MTETDTERPIRTFHPRRGRMSARHAGALDRLWPTHGVPVTDGDRTPLDLTALFGREAPRVLEIGFGMGDATAAMAAADPGRDYLAVEVHTPGIGNLLALVEERGIGNVRVAHGDAMELVHRLAPGSLDAVHVFFPDPWPKARHHKRRLIRPAHVALLRERLRIGGVLHCATDWPDYAEAMAETLAADPGLHQAHPDPAAPPDGTAARPDSAAAATTRLESAAGRHEGAAGRPETKFERRGRDAGRPITDLIFRRA